MSTAAKITIVILALLTVMAVIVAALVAGFIARKPLAAPEVQVAAPAGAALERIRRRGEVRVGMDTGNPPWIGSPPMFFLNEKGERDGFEYQLAKEVAKAAGVGKVELVHHLYAEFEDALVRDEDLDVVIGGFSPYPAPKIAWSKPYFDFGLCLIVRSDSPIQTTADLVGKKIGVFKDEAAVDAVNHLVHGYKSLQQYQDGYLDLLSTGVIDAFLYDYPFTVAELKTYYTQNPHRRGSLKIAQYNLTDSTYAVAVRATEPELLQVVNTAIDGWKGQDAYTLAVKKYLRNDEGNRSPTEGAYVVAAGDSLMSIASRQLGGAEHWTEIWALNKDHYASPNLIEVGDHLVLPDHADPR